MGGKKGFLHLCDPLLAVVMPACCCCSVPFNTAMKVRPACTKQHCNKGVDTPDLTVGDLFYVRNSRDVISL